MSLLNRKNRLLVDCFRITLQFRQCLSVIFESFAHLSVFESTNRNQLLLPEAKRFSDHFRQQCPLILGTKFLVNTVSSNL